MEAITVLRDILKERGIDFCDHIINEIDREVKRLRKTNWLLDVRNTELQAQLRNPNYKRIVQRMEAKKNEPKNREAHS